MIRADRSGKAAPQRTHEAATRDPALAAKIKHNAWMIAVLALLFYFGFICWNLWRASKGF